MVEIFLTKKRREFIANRFGDVGNAVLIALVIGEFVSSEQFNFLRFSVGLGIAIAFYAFGAIIIPKE
ncbi:MAG: hypothetical protein HY564_00570 [Candidatus Jacksonbacteria bacterium]|nr:hypothetical protein [Candidatus Jacksonbacteria bacterium]